MRTIALPKMRNVSIEKKLSKSYCFDSGIQNPCLNFKTDSQRKKRKGFWNMRRPRRDMRL